MRLQISTWKAVEDILKINWLYAKGQARGKLRLYDFETNFARIEVLHFGTDTTIQFQSDFNSTCSPIWGDARRISPEACDDGNVVSGDGCSSIWTVEQYMQCSGGSFTSKDVCTAIWGDAHRIDGYEQWDDGNLIADDGCSPTWAIDVGFRWIGGSRLTPDVWTPIPL